MQQMHTGKCKIIIYFGLDGKQNNNEKFEYIKREFLICIMEVKRGKKVGLDNRVN